MASSLLAIVLVTASPNQGNRIIFSYPPAPHAISRRIRPIYRNFNLDESSSRPRRSSRIRRESEATYGTVDSEDESSTATNSSSESELSNEEEYFNDILHYQGEGNRSSEDESTVHRNLKTKSSSLPKFGETENDPWSQDVEPGTSTESNTHYVGDGTSKSPTRPYTHYLGLENSLLASLLIPSRLELCDRRFELTVDHLAFIGHPVWLGGRRKRAHKRDTSHDLPASSRRSSSDPMQETGTGRGRTKPDDSHSETVHDRESLSMESQTETITEESDLTPLPAVPASLQENSNLRPTSLSPERVTERISLDKSLKSNDQGFLEYFHFALVIDTPPDRHLSNHLEVFYRELVIKMTAALKGEERTSGWLSQESIKLLKARDQAIDRSVPYPQHINDLIQTSSLCAALANLYDSIKAGKTARFELNESLDMSLILHEEYFQDAGLIPSDYSARALMTQPFPARSRLGENRMGRIDNLAEFAPWQTVLTLEDPNELMLEVPENSPLYNFLQIVQPTLTFAEYETLLDLSTEAIKELAEHLVYWRKGKIISAVSLRNIYVPNQVLDPSQLVKHSLAFAIDFPSLPPLATILGAISSPKQFGASIPGKGQRTTYFSALIWLLKNDLVTQMNLYVRIIASPAIKEKVRNMTKRDGTMDDIESRINDDNNSGTSSLERIREGIAISKRQGSAPTFSTSLDKSSGVPSPSDASFSPWDPKGIAIASSQKRSVSLVTKSRSSRNLATSKGSSPGSIGGPEAIEEPGNPRNSSVIAEPGQPTVWERRWLAQIISDKDPEAVNLFHRLAPYYNGRYSLEAMAFHSNVSRRDIRSVLATFEHDLLTFLAP